MLALAALAVLAWSSCASPTRQRVLAALFDDPPPTEAEKAAAQEAVEPVVVVEKPERRSVKRVEWAGSWHGPHAAGLCQACHSGTGENPAAGGEVARLRRSPEQLCVGCHSRDSLLDLLGADSPSALHGPVASGHCTACHVPHRSREPALLRIAAEKLCLGCHRADDRGAEHPEVDGLDCTACHDPHAPQQVTGAAS